MKSKAELLKMQIEKNNQKEEKYIKIMEDILKVKYKDGLDFDKIPHVERLVCNYDSNEDIHFYTNVEKEFIEAIKKTTTFKQIELDLINNGYTYEFSDYCRYGTISGRPDWGINLIIR